MRCSYFLWRFGQASPLGMFVDRFLGWLIFLLWLGYVFVEKEFVSHFEQGSIALIDLLFGLPIIVAMGLVFMIIWKGFIRAVLCLMGKLVAHENRE